MQIRMQYQILLYNHVLQLITSWVVSIHAYKRRIHFHMRLVPHAKVPPLEHMIPIEKIVHKKPTHFCQLSNYNALPNLFSLNQSVIHSFVDQIHNFNKVRIGTIVIVVSWSFLIIPLSILKLLHILSIPHKY